jgi:hypothetical protein
MKEATLHLYGPKDLLVDKNYLLKILLAPFVESSQEIEAD